MLIQRSRFSPSGSPRTSVLVWFQRILLPYFSVSKSTRLFSNITCRNWLHCTYIELFIVAWCKVCLPTYRTLADFNSEIRPKQTFEMNSHSIFRQFWANSSTYFWFDWKIFTGWLLLSPFLLPKFRGKGDNLSFSLIKSAYIIVKKVLMSDGEQEGLTSVARWSKRW